MSNKMIYLEEYRVTDANGNKAKVFTGRDRGEEIRRRTQIDDIYDKYENIEIVIPKDVYSINPSFLEEFLINVVKALGKEKFLKKFKFKSLGEYHIEKSLNEAIDRILRGHTALG